MMRRATDVALVALGGAAMIAGALGVATAAGAIPVPETGVPGLLRLDAEPYDPLDDFVIRPGERVLWAVTATLDAPTTGELKVRVEASEPLAESDDGLRLEVAHCPEPWVLPAGDGDATCDGGPGTAVIAEEPFATADEREWALGAIAPGVPRHFLVTMSLPLGVPAGLADEAARVGFGFTAWDDSQPAQLGTTGTGMLGPLLLGAGLLAAGAGIARIRAGRTGAGRTDAAGEGTP